MAYTDQEKVRYVLMLNKHGYIGMVRKVRQEDGRGARIPPESTVRNWLKKLEANGSLKQQNGENRLR